MDPVVAMTNQNFVPGGTNAHLLYSSLNFSISKDVSVSSVKARNFMVNTHLASYLLENFTLRHFVSGTL